MDKYNRSVRLRRTNIMIKKVFLYHKVIQEAVDEVLAERESQLGGCAGGSGVARLGISYDISSPVERQVEMLMGPIKEVIITNHDGINEVIPSPVEWLKVVGETMKFFEETNKEIHDVLEERFFKNWSVYHSCSKHFIDKNTFYRLIDTGLQFAKECAIQLSLVKVF